MTSGEVLLSERGVCLATFECFLNSDVEHPCHYCRVEGFVSPAGPVELQGG